MSKANPCIVYWKNCEPTTVNGYSEFILSAFEINQRPFRFGKMIQVGVDGVDDVARYHEIVGTVISRMGLFSILYSVIQIQDTGLTGSGISHFRSAGTGQK